MNAVREGVSCIAWLGCARRHALNDPKNKPERRSNGSIQKNISKDAKADDDVSTKFMLMPIGRHEPYPARPEKPAVARSDELLEAMPSKEEQRSNDAQNGTDENRMWKLREAHDLTRQSSATAGESERSFPNEMLFS